MKKATFTILATCISVMPKSIRIATIAGANLDADNFIANCKSAAASVTSTCKYQSTRIQIAF